MCLTMRKSCTGVFREEPRGRFGCLLFRALADADVFVAVQYQ